MVEISVCSMVRHGLRKYLSLTGKPFPFQLDLLIELNNVRNLPFVVLILE